MKNIFKIIVPLLIIVVFLCACSENETPDMGTFVERYNKNSNVSLLFSDIIGTEKDGGEEYSFSAVSNGESGKKILTKLFANKSKKLYECRIVAAKSDGKTKTAFSAEDRERFFSSVLASFCAFSGLGEEKAKSVILQLGLDKEETFLKSGERTKQADEYYLVSLSNDVAFEVIIYNTWLKKIEETEKPESKPLFEETTKIRTETVPHK